MEQGPDRQHVSASPEGRSHEGQVPPGGCSRETPGPARSAGARRLLGLTVLVVDDDEDSLDYFAMALRTAGASVLATSTAMGALRIVLERRPDVILTDIAMPDQDGYWLVRQIRATADPAVHTIPVVATTAYGRVHSRERALAAGFTDHVAKPVEPDRLYEAISRAAGR